MAKKGEMRLITALDIGTSKIAAVVGQLDSDGHIEVIGLGTHPTTGLKKGVVVDIESTVNSIQRAIEEAELTSGISIRSVTASISGNHIRSLNSNGAVAISGTEVHAIDVERVIDAAKAVAIPNDQMILHILPQEYTIDNQDGIRNPIGMSGVRLEAKVHIITCAQSAAHNVIKCIERCNLAVDELVFDPMASSYAVLLPDERELGVCLVDMGGGTMSIAIFIGGSMRYSNVISLAGGHVTNDIAVALRTPTKYAEAIKCKYGATLPHLVEANEHIDVPAVGERPPRNISQSKLVDVIGARYEEFFQLLLTELRRTGMLERIPAGMVLTGGASSIRGGQEMAEQLLQMPVRIGYPENVVSGLEDVINDPIYSTSIGLLLYTRQLLTESANGKILAHEQRKGIWGRIRHWLRENF